MRLKDRVIVVTGASMGIGEAIARACVSEGARVVFTSRDLARAEAARARASSLERTLAVACDVSQRGDIERLLQATLARFGKVDVWINNAGVGLLDSVAQMSLDDCRHLFDTNFFSITQAMQVVAPVMRRQGGGSIINISSAAGYIAVPFMAAYGASKHALNCITKAARLELRDSGIHVMNVCPGYIVTDFAANAIKGTERKRLGSAARTGTNPETVAKAVIRGYLKRKREIIVPWNYRLLIVCYQLVPRLIERIMLRSLRPADEVIAEAEAARRAR
jgi:short-subunit dehydrogenase